MNEHLGRTNRLLAGGLHTERPWPIKVGSLLRNASLFVALLLATGFSHCEAQEMIDSEREANVKAVFLYSFGRFVEWPEIETETVDTDFVIALLGESRVSGKLQRIAASRKIAGRDIRLIQVKAGEPVPPCQILFVAGQLDENQQRAIVETTAERPILVVGESLGFADRGADINFYVLGANVRFQINATTARQRGLQLNAKLLSLGDRVGGPTASK